MPIADRQITVADYFTGWLASRTTTWPSTAVSYVAIVDIYVKPVSGTSDLTEYRLVSANIVRCYFAVNATRERQSRPPNLKLTRT